MNTLGAFICCRNGFELDYSFELAAESLLKICDQLVLCDSDSTDGAREAMQRMADKDSRIKVVNWPWPSPKGESHHWFLKWLNFARQQLTTDMCLYLDADEVLSDAPECHAAIKEAVAGRKCIALDRVNFWRDAQSIIPEGHCCGRWCVRLGPQEYECTSDEPRHKGELPIVDNAIRDERIKVFHLGFLREKKAFYRKAHVVLDSWFGRFDQRLERGENEDKQVWETECEFTDLLVPFNGYLPDAVQKWLADRGHVTDTYLPIVEVESFAPKPVQVSDEAPQSGPVNLLHSGDYGDLIFGMSVFKGLGKVNLYFQDRNITKRIIERLPLITDLLKSQSYIGECKPHEGEVIHWNASDFRQNHEYTKSLARSHFDHMRGALKRHIVFDLRSPWITGIDPDPRSAGKIVIARSPRYQNHYFRWAKIVQHFGAEKLIFVGLPEEHAAFVRAYGDVTYIPTANMMEVARLIKGSQIFIGNQSSPLALAEAMKHPRIAEVCPWQPDVIVAYPQKDCQYSADGACDILGFTIGPAMLAPESVATWVVPPGGWKWKDQAGNTHFQVLERIVMQTCNVDQPTARVMLIEYNAAKNPAFFETAEIKRHLMLFNQACENAKA